MSSIFSCSAQQDRIEQLLKHKGIGPVGSKSLKLEQLNELTDLLADPTVSLSTQGSLFAAFSLLDNQTVEEEWFAKAKTQYFAEPITEMLNHEHPLAKLLAKTLNKISLNYQESRLAIKHLLDKECPDYIKAAFLEGQRVKRETHQENLGFLHELFEQANRIETHLATVIDIADNYDGYNRTPCLTPFVAATLAACGFATVIHGPEIAAPKMGKTSHQVLKLAGYNVSQSLEAAKGKLEDPQIGWAFVDQSQSFKPLFNLHKMRKEMVKRPMLATFEKILQPIRAKGGNLLTMGYTHTAYKDHLSALIAEYNNCPRALITRGVEGTSRPSLARRTTTLWFDGESVHEEFFDPTEFGFETTEEPLDKAGDSLMSLEMGLAALNNDDMNGNIVRDQIELWATALIAGFRLMPDHEAREVVSQAISSGKAYAHFFKGL